MENFLFYIGKTALATGSFYFLYLALFQHQKHFIFNRIYLPVSLAISFIIPLITFTSVRYIQPIEISTVNSFAYLPETTATNEVQMVYQWYHYLFAAYTLGIICFLSYLVLGHFKAMKIIRFSRLKELFGAQVNVTNKDVHPFSFFSRIVLSEGTLENPNLEMIVNHEMVHVQEKHTLDILFAEILFLFQWFNPFAWLIRDAMRNNLEYLTDHQVTQLHNAEHYQLAMVGLAHKKGVAPFLTALNGSQLKNRIIMMKKKTKNRYSLLKQFVVLPLLAFLVMSLSNKEVKTEIAQTNDHLSSVNAIANTVEEPTSMKIVVDGKLIPTDHPSLKEMDFSKNFDSGKICEALELNNIEVNSMVIDEKQPTLYIRTSAYIEGTNKEFENHTSTQTTRLSSAKTNNYYAIDGKIVSKDEFEKQGKKGFDNVIFLTGNDATKKYGDEFDGTIADATTGSSNFTIKKTITVTGKVSNEEGEPIAAANVVVKGVATGTITDKSGYYALETEKNSTLIFSMFGYEKKEVEVNKQKEINVTLKNETTAKNNQIEIVPVKEDKNTSKIEIVPLDNEKKKSLKYTTKDSKEPHFYIVDGKETEDVEEIDAKDIKTMSVLKGESATALYGEKGKDGAVIITTKGAKRKKISDPLVVVDGKLFSGHITEIAPENINSIKVLKNDAATSIYGPKAKDGAILITSKVKGIDPTKQPLYVINGVESTTDHVSTINPGNIESISVLKGPTATQTYGQQAKDGAIIISTKDLFKKGKNLPLFVVDGERYTDDIEEIDQNNIKSITVLKDQGAKAVYGEQGKNGVVLITTKTEEIKSEKDLRKFIAQRINYPEKPHSIGIEGTSKLYVKVNRNGVVYSVSDKKTKNAIQIDDVVVTAYPQKTENEETDKVIEAQDQFNWEVQKVINQLPTLNIPEYNGKTICVVVKFIIEDS